MTTDPPNRPRTDPHPTAPSADPNALDRPDAHADPDAGDQPEVRDERDRSDQPEGREEPNGRDENDDASGDAARTPGETGGDGSGAPSSGLRNPAAAMRGVGAATLVLEAIVLLMAIAPLRMLGGRWAGWGIGASVVLAVLCCVLAGLLRHRWAWYAGLVVQALVVVAGVAQWAIAVLGVVFGAIWLYVLHLRRTILGTGPTKP